MDRKEIEEYIKKLQKLESDILNDDSDEVSIMDDLNKLLGSLGNDIKEQINYDVNKFEVKVKRIRENTVIPSYSNDGDAGLDFTSTEIIKNTEIDITYGTGISLEIPKGYVGLLFPRSSIRKYDLSLSNSVGVIDSTYRGEIQVTFKKTMGNMSTIYNIGDRICQMMILPYPKVSFVEVNELSQTQRGNNGFGSTGT